MLSPLPAPATRIAALPAPSNNLPTGAVFWRTPVRPRLGSSPVCATPQGDTAPKTDLRSTAPRIASRTVAGAGATPVPRSGGVPETLLPPLAPSGSAADCEISAAATARPEACAAPHSQTIGNSNSAQFAGVNFPATLT